jgi:hypothetical protein
MMTLFGQTAFAQGTVTLTPTGTTNEADEVILSCVITDGKLAVNNWLVELWIDGVKWDNIGKCTLNQSCAGTVGIVTVPTFLGNGKYEVYIKVKLNDDSTPADKREVEFKLKGSCGTEFDDFPIDETSDSIEGRASETRSVFSICRRQS